MSGSNPLTPTITALIQNPQVELRRLSRGEKSSDTARPAFREPRRARSGRYEVVHTLTVFMAVSASVRVL